MADAVLHIAAMALMLVAMLPSSMLLVLGLLVPAQAVAAVLLRRRWRVHGAFLDLLAVTAAVALPLSWGHAHGDGIVVALLGGVVILGVWAAARVAAGIRGRGEWAMAAVMAVSMLAMLGH